MSFEHHVLTRETGLFLLETSSPASRVASATIALFLLALWTTGDQSRSDEKCTTASVTAAVQRPQGQDCDISLSTQGRKGRQPHHQGNGPSTWEYALGLGSTTRGRPSAPPEGGALACDRPAISPLRELGYSSPVPTPCSQGGVGFSARPNTQPQRSGAGAFSSLAAALC